MIRLAPLLCLALVPYAAAETITHNLEAGMAVEVAYPDLLLAGRDGHVSILVRNGGWEEKRNVTLAAEAFYLEAGPGISVPSLSSDGTYGAGMSVSAPAGIEPGTYFLNMRYSHVLVAGNERPQPPYFADITGPIQVKERAEVLVRASAPASVFAGAAFGMDVEVSSPDARITDVIVSIVPPADVGFEGTTQHAFSSVGRTESASASSRIVTSADEISAEHRLPFQITTSYVDDLGEPHSDSQTVHVTLRPRSFTEITPDGGIWIGGLFIAPYVSIGTLVGIPAGAIISLLIRKRRR